MRDTVIHGDALEVLKTLADNSIDAVVTDPPSAIHFMDKSWDSDKGGRKQWVAWLSRIMTECLRILKPGGHALVWALPRKAHWTALALEDAGFEVRDCITHLFGSGFPKSKNLGNGMGSALKPATEFWWLCRKPLSESSLEANFRRWGTGGLNIDMCRVGLEGMEDHKTAGSGAIGTANGIYHSSKEPINSKQIARAKAGLNPRYDPQGRFPSHLLLSHSVWCIPRGMKRVQSDGHWTHKREIGNGTIYHGGGREEIDFGSIREEEVEDWECVEGCPVRILNEQSGVRKSGGGVKSKGGHSIGFLRGENNWHFDHDGKPYEASEGGASRYFQTFHYFAKASRTERNAGCEGLPAKQVTDADKWAVNDRRSGTARQPTEWKPEPQGNNHPTVKSLSLMSWLCRLITPPGGTVLDCFCGSGSTLVACVKEGYHFIGIEQQDTKEEPYATIARERVQYAQGL